MINVVRGSTFVSVEIGNLEYIFLSGVTINKVYMVIRTEERNFYLGSLIFERAPAARAVFNFLQRHAHKSIASIAAIDLDKLAND